MILVVSVSLHYFLLMINPTSHPQTHQQELGINLSPKLKRMVCWSCPVLAYKSHWLNFQEF